MSQPEDQKSVFAWIDESFPDAPMRRRITHLFEEVTELAAASGTVDLDKLLSVVQHAWQKAQAGEGTMAGEIADVRISLIGIASAAGVDEQAALDSTMAANRARTLADRQARETEKQKLEPFKP